MGYWDRVIWLSRGIIIEFFHYLWTESQALNKYCMLPNTILNDNRLWYITMSMHCEPQDVTQENYNTPFQSWKKCPKLYMLQGWADHRGGVLLFHSGITVVYI